MSETPRTDAVIRSASHYGEQGEYWFEVVNADHARKLETELIASLAALSAAEQRAEGMQARIDELMLEYCPDEMTPEQIEEWGKHQKPVSEETAARINAALTPTTGDSK